LQSAAGRGEGFEGRFFRLATQAWKKLIKEPSGAGKRTTHMWLAIDPLIAVGVVVATAATDAVYVMFTSAVVTRRRMRAANWSSVWYLLSSFAVIHYTENWAYVAFAAAGSWIGAFTTISFMHRTTGGPPVGAAPD
jgi:uncharacterized membrane protein YhaH (DUF805 family)